MTPINFQHTLYLFFAPLQLLLCLIGKWLKVNHFLYFVTHCYHIGWGKLADEQIVDSVQFFAFGIIFCQKLKLNKGRFFVFYFIEFCVQNLQVLLDWREVNQIDEFWNFRGRSQDYRHFLHPFNDLLAFLLHLTGKLRWKFGRKLKQILLDQESMLQWRLKHIRIHDTQTICDFIEKMKIH